MNLSQKLDIIIADKTKSVSDRIGESINLIQGLAPETIEYYQSSATVYNAIRNMVLEEENPSDNIGDLLICNSLLAEIYQQLNTPWLITPIAQHTYDLLQDIEVDDQESIQMIISVLDRMCYVLRGGAHHRLILKLYALEFRFLKLLNPINKDALREISEEIIAISTLIQDNSILDTLREEIEIILDEKLIKEIVENPYVGNIIIDNIEYTLEYENVVDKIDETVAKEAELDPQKFNSLSTIWQRKKEILSQQYNIDWHTPSELNPHTLFE